MVDVVSPEVRSRMMSRIRTRDTLPELQVRRYLHSRGFRFRLNDRSLPGCPDVVLRKWNVVIFVQGCFWHGHKNCRYFRLPGTRSDFWSAKIHANVARDKLCAEQLDEGGWRVALVWECALRIDIEGTLARLDEFLRSSERVIDIRSDRQAPARME